MQERDPRPHGCGHGEDTFFAVMQMWVYSGLIFAYQIHAKFTWH